MQSESALKVFENDSQRIGVLALPRTRCPPTVAAPVAARPLTLPLAGDLVEASALDKRGVQTALDDLGRLKVSMVHDELCSAEGRDAGGL